jgi:N-acetylglucosamine-6-phosphate deacetylase
MLTQIINTRILTPQGWLKDGSVLIRDNKILEVTNCDLAIIGAKLIDAKGMYIVPGGVEIHVHGGGGRPTGVRLLHGLRSLRIRSRLSG